MRPERAASSHDMMNAVPIRLDVKPRWRTVQAGESITGHVVKLVPPNGLTGPKAQAVLQALGGLLAGLVLAAVLAVIGVFFSFLGGGGPGWFPVWLGGGVAVGGAIFAVVNYRPELAKPHLRIADHGAMILLPGYRKPVLVPRDAVRVVAIDDREVKLFQPNPRFPVGSPAGAEPGSHLFAGMGSSLPVFRSNPGDVPNVAVLFSRPIRIGRRAPQMRSARIPFNGTRAQEVTGMLVRAEKPIDAAAAFARWGVVRPIDQGDVTALGLAPPKGPSTLQMLVVFGIALAAMIAKTLIWRSSFGGR